MQEEWFRDEVVSKWNGQFLSLAFSMFVTKSKQGKNLTTLAMKSINSKNGSKKYLKEVYKVLAQVDGVKWIGEK
jgi:hypothetical protein